MRLTANSLLPSQPVLMGLLAFIVVLWSRAIFNDGDTFWHLVAGGWIIDHGAIPHTDPFSFTFQGKPWLMHEWLAEVVMAFVFRLCGWSGLALLTATAIGLTVWLVARVASRWLGSIALWLTVLLGLAMIGPHLLVRPHILILPILAAWIGELVEARAEDRKPGWWLIGLMIVWANMHGSFLLGLCLICPFALEALLIAPANKKRAGVIGWGGFGVVALIASLLTPHGLDGLMFPIKLLLMPGIAGVNEWAAADFSKQSVLEVGLLAALFVIIRQRAAIPVIRLILLLGLLHLTLQHIRHEMVLGIVAVLLLAEPLGRTFTGTLNGKPGQHRSAYPAMAGVAVVILALAVVRLSLPVAEPRTFNTPVAALSAVPEPLRAQPMLNDYDIGGYLIWEGVKPFIDGRTDMYGADFFARYNRAVLPDPVVLQQTLEGHKIQWTLLRNNSNVVMSMDHMPGWKRLYTDPQFVVHVRQ